MNRKRNSKNSIISRIINRIDPVTKAQTSTKMNIAAMIDDAMKEKGWSKKDLMEKMGKKNPSTVSRWLSGTNNFTVDTLVELSLLLDIKLVAMYEEKKDLTYETAIPTNKKLKSSERVDKGNKNTLSISENGELVAFNSDSENEFIKG